MAEFTNSIINTMLDWLTGKTTPAAVAGRFITVFNGDPTSGGTEVIATISGSANRQALTANMGNAAAGVATSTGLITFTNNAAGGATVNFVAIYDAITGGNLMAYTAVTSKTVVAGDGLTIPIGNLTIAIV
jgi:hypothetical protein